MPRREHFNNPHSIPRRSLQIRPARDQVEFRDALALMIQENEPVVKRQEVENILNLHQAGKIDLSHLLVAVSEQKIRAALLMMIQADFTAILWPPAYDFSGEPADSCSEILDLLVQRSFSIAKEHNCELIQATVGCQDVQSSELLVRNGLAAVGTLLFLQRPAMTQQKQGRMKTPHDHEETCRLVPITQGIDDEILGELVLSTYVDSADFPELQTRRSGALCLQTHRLQGEYLPENWFVIEEQGIQVGVLFFSFHSELDQWELTYLGVIPQYRGKGIARRVIEKSFEHPERKYRGVFLGVDSRNDYAVRLYTSMGFVTVSRQNVFAWNRQLGK